MSARTVPLDPDSPKGIEVARRLTIALAKAYYGIQERRAAAPTPTPRPSTPPTQPPRPTNPPSRDLAAQRAA